MEHVIFAFVRLDYEIMGSHQYVGFARFDVKHLMKMNRRILPGLIFRRERVRKTGKIEKWASSHVV
jgi:hypothetical protein